MASLCHTPNPNNHHIRSQIFCLRGCNVGIAKINRVLRQLSLQIFQCECLTHYWHKLLGCWFEAIVPCRNTSFAKPNTERRRKLVCPCLKDMLVSSTGRTLLPQNCQMRHIGDNPHRRLHSNITLLSIPILGPAPKGTTIRVKTRHSLIPDQMI